MSKISLKKLGINAEIFEKANVMTPFNMMLFIAILLFLGLIYTKILWIKVFCSIIFFVIIATWIVIYVTHSIKNPELLQSESYRIEQHRIEAGMLEEKNGGQEYFEPAKTNLIAPIKENNLEDENAK